MFFFAYGSLGVCGQKIILKIPLVCFRYNSAILGTNEDNLKCFNEMFIKCGTLPYQRNRVYIICLCIFQTLTKNDTLNFLSTYF